MQSYLHENVRPVWTLIYPVVYPASRFLCSCSDRNLQATDTFFIPGRSAEPGL